MEKVFDAVASHIGSDKSVLIFLLDGKKISGGRVILKSSAGMEHSFHEDLTILNYILPSENTPKMLEMEDDDQIDCMMAQVGGSQ